jgi:hypothetical protein
MNFCQKLRPQKGTAPGWLETEAVLCACCRAQG